MQLFLVAAITFASTVFARYDGNLNYNSPSRRHPFLGIDVPKVQLAKRGLASSAWDPAELKFTHGVASGDPYPASVILWTRISPVMENDRSNVTVEGNAALYNHDTEKYIQASPNPICVEYQVAKDARFLKVVTTGQAYTTSDVDYTVKVEATGLHPFTEYYYRFNVCGSDNTSDVGRTKTSPAVDDDVSAIGLAVFSCAKWASGYYNALGNSARKDKVDYVVFLGDYIYEDASGTLGKDPRATNPQNSLFTLYDYRTRLAQHRTDLDLLLSHQKFAWIPVWDDHEVSDNGYRDGASGMNNTEDSFLKHGRVSVDQRKMNAVRAYFEWMPIRQVDMDDNLRIWRSFSMGKLLDLVMLDTRNYDRSVTSLGWNDQYVSEIKDDAGRSLMGSRQENWFYNQLSRSSDRGAAWRIVGNQIIFSRIEDGSGELNGDSWDGYTANRNRTLSHLYSNNISNTVFLSGDSHKNWVSDLAWLDEKPYDERTGLGAIGVEFAGTAVSSTGMAGPITAANKKSKGFVAANRELQWNEGYYRGYYELHVTPTLMTAQFYGCPTVATRNPFEISLANFTVKAGDNHIQRTEKLVVEAGGLKTGAGTVMATNRTLNTETGTWNLTSFDRMYI